MTSRWHISLPAECKAGGGTQLEKIQSGAVHSRDQGRQGPSCLVGREYLSVLDNNINTEVQQKDIYHFVRELPVRR